MASKRKAVQIPEADFTAENYGSICVLQPLSAAANVWVSENLPEDVMKWGGGIVVEPRYLMDIILGARAEGLTVRA